MQKFNISHPEWVDQLRADEFRVFSTFFQVLENRGPKGQFIVVLRPNNGIKIFTPEFIAENPLAMIRCNLFFLDRLSKNIEVQICGVIVCNSFKGFTIRDNLRLSKASKVNEQIATFRFMTILGLRLSGAFMFDQPAYMTWLWPIVRMFLSEKLRSRFHLCGANYEKIKEVRLANGPRPAPSLPSHKSPRAVRLRRREQPRCARSHQPPRTRCRCFQTLRSARRASAAPWRMAPSAGSSSSPPRSSGRLRPWRRRTAIPREDTALTSVRRLPASTPPSSPPPNTSTLPLPNSPVRAARTAQCPARRSPLPIQSCSNPRPSYQHPLRP